MSHHNNITVVMYFKTNLFIYHSFETRIQNNTVGKNFYLQSADMAFGK